MKCLVPSQNVKIIARTVSSLAKIGDEVFIDVSDEGLVFRTVNLAQSAFAEFRFFRSFFSTYIFDIDEEQLSGCKVTVKSFLSVFKNPHCVDKQVESCEIKFRPTGNVVVFLIKYANSFMRKYYLPVLEHERLQVNVPDDAPNGLTVSSKFLATAVKNFRHSEDEVTLSVEKEKTFLKNHLELKRDENFMRTELCFHPTEFERYSVLNAIAITFSFKELRAVLAFAEPSNLPVMASFSMPGRPIIFKVENHPAYEASYVVSTLNSTNANVESSLVGSQRTSVPSQRGDSQRNSSQRAHRGSEPIDFNSEQGDRIEQQMSMEAGASTNNLRANTPQNRPIQMMRAPDDLDMQVTPARPSQVMPCRIEETATSSSNIHSSYGSNSEIFNNASPVSLSQTPGPSFPSIPAVALNEPLDDNAQRLMNLVFSRCNNRKNLLDSVHGHKIILAGDSDSEQLCGHCDSLCSRCVISQLHQKVIRPQIAACSAVQTDRSTNGDNFVSKATTFGDYILPGSKFVQCL